MSRAIVGLIFSPGFGLLSRHEIIYFLLALSFLLAACRFSPTPEPRSNYLVVGIESNPIQLDPRYSTDANAARERRSQVLQSRIAGFLLL